MGPNLVLQRNWEQVRLDVAAACHSAGRAVDTVQIVGVSKYVGPELAFELAEVGCSILGENRPQSLWQKCDWFTTQPQAPDVAWHMIGHLQRNKIKRTLPLIQLLHSLDSLRLAQAISEEATQAGYVVNALVDVNVTEDSTKTGLPANELESFMEQAIVLPGLDLRGLMAMSSLDGNSALARREFSQVRGLHEKMQLRFGKQLANWSELSMGMSNDFREAIEEGATLVRIGSRLWEGVLPQNA